jgi:MFS transporter, LPLT family, lysophospholipid transporter
VPKGRVMFYANGIKVIGCLMMLFGAHPLLAYLVVGLGAAAYSPAKYGILTELLPSSQLVKANGWVEGLTILSIILGVVLGGQLVGAVAWGYLQQIDIPWIETSIDTPPEAAVAVLTFFYVIAALFNQKISRTQAPLQPLSHNIIGLIKDFYGCNNRLWHDKLGQISLATTTLFWGVSGNLRIIVFAWAAAALSYNDTQASNLVGFLAIGIAVGAVAASMIMRLHMAPKVIGLGIAMGVLLVGMNIITSVAMAVPFFMVLGAIAGFLVVPMNALLQHRGHNLMGAGRSIAVQNFNEQACIFGISGLYTLMIKWGCSVFTVIGTLSTLVAVSMVLIHRWHASNCRRHQQEVNTLLTLAAQDKH